MTKIETSKNIAKWILTNFRPHDFALQVFHLDLTTKAIKAWWTNIPARQSRVETWNFVEIKNYPAEVVAYYIPIQAAAVAILNPWFTPKF
jgi:hypothetical protein